MAEMPSAKLEQWSCTMNCKTTQINFVNGVIINGGVFGGLSVEMTHIDETKTTSGNAKQLAINSKSATVSITAGATSNITAHLYGECGFDGSAPTLSITETNNKVAIDVKQSGNYFTGHLNLDITVPADTYSSINVVSQSGDISVDGSVESSSLQFKTQSGDVTIETKCENISATTMSGDIELELTARTDSHISLQTMSGDVDISLSNVAEIDFSSSTMSGDVRNRFRGSKGGHGHTVNVSASTMSGDIKIR